MSENNKCKECKWLTMERHTIGHRCENPNKDFYTDLSMFKGPCGYACKLFEPREANKTRVDKIETYYIENTPIGAIVADAYEKALKAQGLLRSREDSTYVITIESKTTLFMEGQNVK